MENGVSSATIILGMSALYMAALALISFLVRRYSRTAEGFVSGGRAFPAAFIGLLMASEFIGTSASLGTAQGAYEYGISAAWNLAAIGVGFVLFSFLLARKYKELGENTVSGVLARIHGDKVRLATSVVMIAALLIVAVAVYAGGSAVFSSLLGMDKVSATVLTGVLAALYVAIGGMRSVVYTNVLHAIVLLAGIVLAAVLPLARVGGLGQLRDALPAGFFSFDGVGWAQIMAWMVAGVGATFATQYIVQAINSVPNPSTAKRASVYSAFVLIPYGLLSAVAGMCAAVLYPNIDSLEALPALVADMDTLAAGVVIAGLAAALFGTAAALTLAISTLLLKDFYRPYFNKAGDDRRDLMFVRAATIAAGLLPIALALFATDVLAVTYLAKSLRAALAVLVVLMFYAPRYGTSTGAIVSIGAALAGTVGWFMAGNPFGIDDAYIAVLTPLVVMTISHLRGRRRPHEPLTTATGSAGSQEQLAGRATG